MALTYQASSLQMEWCLDCHRHPQDVLRPKDQVFNMRWKRPDGESGADLARAYKLRSALALTNCTTCHR